MGAPPAAEVGVLHGQFADEGGQSWVVRVAGRLHPQLRHTRVGDVLPVRIQRPKSRIQEHQPHHVALLLRDPPEVGDQRGGHRVPGEDVHPAAQHHGRGAGEVVQQPPQAGLDLLYRDSARPRLVPAREPEHVVALVVVQAQDLGKAFQYRLRRLSPALFQPRVVVGADGREQGHFLAAQTLDPSPSPGLRQSDHGGAELHPAGLEEGAQLIAVRVAAHGSSLAANVTTVRGPVPSQDTAVGGCESPISPAYDTWKSSRRGNSGPPRKGSPSPHGSRSRAPRATAHRHQGMPST